MSKHLEEDRSASRNAMLIVAALVVTAVAWWWWSQRDDPSAAVEPPPPTAAQPVIATPFPEEPVAIQHPIEPPPADAAAPEAPSVDADAAARQAMGEVFGPAIADWLVNEQLARRLVATVDNLPRNTRIEPLRPLRAPAGPLVVEREELDAAVGEERITLSPANYARYDAVMGLVAALDPADAAATYRRIYPQVQAQYEELGYPSRYFNDRLVQVIDHLLAAPTPQGPLLLEQPKVLYRFADEGLEALSPGQKLMLRIGPAHAQMLKQKLGEFRALVAADPDANTPAGNKE